MRVNLFEKKFYETHFKAHIAIFQELFLMITNCSVTANNMEKQEICILSLSELWLSS